MQRESRWHSRRGFTLLEAIIVMGLTVVGAAMVIPVTLQMVANARNDSAQTMVRTFIEGARSRAVAERRNIELVFTEPNRMSLVRHEVSGTPNRTTVAQMMLEGREEFEVFSSVPDTEEAYGKASFVNYTTSEPPVMFTSDGTLIDSAGDVVNCSIFIGVPGRTDTARAITITGVTGLLRSWKWRGASWQQ